MHTEFDKYALKGNEFLSKLAKNMGDNQDLDAAFRILRSTFHVMRKYITVEESMQVLAQLPMALKSIYVDGWKLHKPHERIKTLDEFAAEILKEEGNATWRDFSNMDEVMQDLRAVIITLAEYVSPSELEEAFGTLPKEIKKVFQMWIPS
jgi:uncharacterized protein (DUF2267 family)